MAGRVVFIWFAFACRALLKLPEFVVHLFPDLSDFMFAWHLRPDSHKKIDRLDPEAKAEGPELDVEKSTAHFSGWQLLSCACESALTEVQAAAAAANVPQVRRDCRQ